MNIFDEINRLASYGLKTRLIEKEDLIYVKNQMLAALCLDGFETTEQAEAVPAVQVSELEEILAHILDYAVEKKTHRR